MIALVHNSPATLAPFRTPNLGVLSSPRRFYRELDGFPWAADNDAFGGAWSSARYLDMLEGIASLGNCLFVTAPDVVGDALTTTERFWEWQPILRDLGQPIAYVTQDGLTDELVPWGEIDALFVGGSTAWKLSVASRELVAGARGRGLWVHMGRCNSVRRIRYAKGIGCDSFDGSSLGWFAGTNGTTKRRRDRNRLGRFLAAADAETQLMLEQT